MIRNAWAAFALTALVAAGCARETTVSGTGPTSGAGGNVAVPTSTGRVPSGTIIEASLDGKLGAKSRVGDKYTASVTQDVVSPAGELLVPRGAKVVGTVVGLKPSATATEPAEIDLSVDRLQMGGVDQPVTGNIVQTNVGGAVGRGVSGKTKARGALRGGAVRGVVGGILGGWQGAAIGGAVGAVTGTAISLGMGKANPVLAAGTGIAIELRKPIRSYAMIRGGRRAY